MRGPRPEEACNRSVQRLMGPPDDKRSSEELDQERASCPASTHPHDWDSPPEAGGDDDYRQDGPDAQQSDQPN